MSAHADKVIPAITLNDVILDATTRGQVESFLSASRQVSTVMSAWGFGKKLSRGKGLVALFSGPSGVGKTMTAEAIAGELGKPLQPIRLDSIVSKYVGETGKNLASLFRSAEESDAVLFIDEADTLFSARLESTDHHARYINQEVNVLLTEIERFDGLLILATNRATSMDSAFERRFPYHIQFEMPDATARAAIWKKLIPSEAPVDGPIQFDDLARRYPVTGGEIKNIVLRAAYAAATNGGRLTHVLMCEAAEGRIPLVNKKKIGFAA
jgi:SpoVK/Ycf46/Vps4 family AAA+-type ATPase